MASHAIVPSIFISYSRKNSVFVEKLVTQLEAAGHKVWIDRKHIHPTANWLETLLRGIAESDCYAAVLTPDLLASDICRVEMNEALALKKTIVPILLSEIGPVPSEIAPFQWVDFRDPLTFDANVAEMRSALSKDPEWRTMHTALLTAALDWDRNRRPWSRLLHGAEIDDAERWLAGSDEKGMRIPAPQHRLYIAASRRFGRLWKIALAGVMIPLVVGVSAGIYISDTRGRETRARELAARAEQIAADPHRIEESALLAIEADERLAGLGVSRTEADTILRNSVKQLLRRSGDGVHPAGIGGMAFDSFGGLVATFPGSVQANVSSINDGITDNTVRIWRIGGGTSIEALPHKSMVFAAVFAYNGLLATGDIDGDVSVWDLSSPSQPETVFNGNSPIVSLAGSRSSPLLAASEESGDVTVWDIQSKKFKYHYQDGNGEGAELIAISTDSNYLASAGEKGLIQIRSLADGKLIRSLRHQNQKAINALTFIQPDLLATGGEMGEFHLWSLPDGADLFPLAHRGTVQDIVHTSGDHPYVATTSRDGSVRILEPAFNRSWQTREFPSGNGLWSAAISPMGRFIAAARGDALVDFWLKREGSITARFAIPTGDLATGILFPDERNVIITDGGGYIHFARMTGGFEVWEVASGRDINRVAISRDSTALAGADFYGHASMWRIDKGDPLIQEFTLPPANPFSFSPDGQWLAAVRDGTLRIVDRRSGAADSVFPADANVGDVAWHPKRPLLAISRRDGGVHIYGRNGQLVRSISEGAVELTFEPAGNVLACVTPNRGLLFWRWELSETTVPETTMREVQHASFAPDTNRLVTLHRDGTLRSWDFEGVNSVKERWSVYVCPQTSALAVGSGGARIAVGCKDGRVQVYERNGEKLAQAEYPGEVESVALDGRIPGFIAAGKDGIKAYYLNSSDLIQEACRRVPSNFTQEQWNQDVGDEKCRTICPNLLPGCGK